MMVALETAAGRCTAAGAEVGSTGAAALGARPQQAGRLAPATATQVGAPPLLQALEVGPAAAAAVLGSQQHAAAGMPQS
jgi:hypothetical protein